VYIINTLNKKKWVFPANKWIADQKDTTLEVTLAPSATEVTTYNVRVKTAAESGAGTNAKVFLDIKGDKGSTGNLELASSITHRNRFQPGCLDIFTVSGTDVGTISQILIGHDNSGNILMFLICGNALLGIEPEWMLKSIEIKNTITEQTFYSDVNKWFDLNNGDKQIIRAVLPSAKTGNIIFFIMGFIFCSRNGR
jgi:hypothetical protein